MSISNSVKGAKSAHWKIVSWLLHPRVAYFCNKLQLCLIQEVRHRNSKEKANFLKHSVQIPDPQIWRCKRWNSKSDGVNNYYNGRFGEWHIQNFLFWVTDSNGTGHTHTHTLFNGLFCINWGYVCVFPRSSCNQFHAPHQVIRTDVSIVRGVWAENALGSVSVLNLYC